MRPLTVNNIKLSCKINIPTNLEFVKKLCLKNHLRVKEFPNFISIHGRFVILFFKYSQIFKSHHVNITKIKNEGEIFAAIENLALLIDCDISDVTFKVDNLTVTGCFDFKVNLPNFVVCWKGPGAIKYSPEIFPAVFVKIENINSIIFSSGNDKKSTFV